MPISLLSPMAREPEAVELFRKRVARRDWRRARRLAVVLDLHRSVPQRLLEQDEAWLERAARTIEEATRHAA